MAVLEEAVSAFLGTMSQQLPLVLSQVIAAAITILVGLVAGKIVGRIVREIVVRSKIDDWISAEDHISIKVSRVLDLVARWIIYFVFLKQAAIFLGIAAVGEFVNSIINVIPSLVEAALLIIVGYAIAVYLKDKVISSKSVYSDLMGKLIFFLIIYLSIALALPFVGIDPTLINNILLVAVGSVGLGLAIALGWGLKDVIRDAAKDYAKKFRISRRK